MKEFANTALNKIRSMRTTELLAVGFVIVLLLLLQQCNKSSNLKEDLRMADQNRLALTDSVRTIKNKWGEEITVKNVLVANAKELKELNTELSKELKKISGDVVYLQRMVGKIKNDTIRITNTVTEYPDGTKQLAWDYDTTYTQFDGRSLAGYSRFVIDTVTGKIIDRGTVITKDEIRIKLTTGLTELDDSYQIFVKTDYPGLKFDQLDGSIVDKKKFAGSSNESSWVFGPYIGAGVGYDPHNRVFGPSINVGVGVMFNINKQIKRLFKK
jgi:hypothetical protein